MEDKLTRGPALRAVRLLPRSLRTSGCYWHMEAFPVLDALSSPGTRGASSASPSPSRPR